MNTDILGLHHITAISDNAKRNLDFYTNALGLRLVKKTVNFDDPGRDRLSFRKHRSEIAAIQNGFTRLRL